MAGAIHQKLLGIIARKMKLKNYEIISFDGDEKLFGDIDLAIPPDIKRHRPDILGINFLNKKLCVGEAKTKSDLSATRTKEQFLDFTEAVTKDGQKVELIIGITKSSERELIQLLKKLNLLNKPDVSYVWMPDELLEDAEKNNNEEIL